MVQYCWGKTAMVVVFSNVVGEHGLVFGFLKAFSVFIHSCFDTSHCLSDVFRWAAFTLLGVHSTSFRCRDGVFIVAQEFF
jgi:hypothetical protein